MPQFISKLQYKTYEKGEYSDEKSRNIEETIDLINRFPWSIEQYADIELTGPSITIEDNEENYLKIGIYYGGRFSVYYNSSDFYYYEKLNLSIDVAIDKLKEFYTGQIDLTSFEKSQYSIGIKSYFFTKKFEYKIKVIKVMLLIGVWNYLFLLTLILSIAAIVAKPSLTILLSLVPAFIFGFIIAYILKKYYRVHGQYLKISRGNDLFLFGDRRDNVKQYDKNNIDKITKYVPKGTRSPNNFELFEITFKDSSIITFSNMLISSYTLSTKFSDKWKLDPIYKEQGIAEMMKNLK
jgi:hypothetical protein